MSTKITYNGKTTELADGYIATLPCKDLKMETDVVVEAPEAAESGGGGSLEAPTISITDGILTITDTNESTKSFDVYSDGVFVANVVKGETLDLSKLGLEVGNRTITAKSLVESGASEALAYEAEADWGSEVQGNWVLRDDVDAYVPIENATHMSIYIRIYRPLRGADTSTFATLQQVSLYNDGRLSVLTTGGSSSVISPTSELKLRTWEIREDYAIGGEIPTEQLKALTQWLWLNATKDTTTDTEALNIITEGE